MINKYFSQTTKEILDQEGWYENRHIDIEKEIDMLKDRGYIVLDSFKKFILNWVKQRFIIPKKNDRFISFKLEKSFIGYDELIINIYPKIIGCEALNRIGSLNGEVALVIDETAKIYALYDRCVNIIGENIYTATENLCTKESRWFDQFTIDTEQKWNDQIIDWKYVRAKEIGNHQEFIKKYPDYKPFYE